MLTDSNIGKAVSNIAQRAERILDDNKIIKTYVEVGILPQIVNKNNQIIYGRRGTGKTHLFRYLESDLKSDDKSIVIYMDCRTLGSAADYSNSSLPIERRCISLFKDIIDEFYDKALFYIAYQTPKNAEKAIEALDNIAKASGFKDTNIVSEEVTERTLEKAGNEDGASVSINPKELINFTFGVKDTKESDIEKTSKYNIINFEKIIFPDINHFLKKLIEYTGSTIYFLIDEWSSLPIELQPFLAEFLKRIFYQYLKFR
ncbi:MAG: hypothetical protein IPG09_03625 [Ignavibacteria bacterium]|nr:hypothetical protein [Ignavibacteria bacterium]